MQRMTKIKNVPTSKDAKTIVNNQKIRWTMCVQRRGELLFVVDTMERARYNYVTKELIILPEPGRPRPFDTGFDCKVTFRR
jgi:hypothetical protein